MGKPDETEEVKTKDQLDNFIGRMEAPGTDELVAEAQNQLTRN